MNKVGLEKAMSAVKTQMLRIFLLIALALAAFTLLLLGSYTDLPSFLSSESSGAGRTKNSLATVVAAAAAREIYPDAAVKFDLEMVKMLWYPNSRVRGEVSSSSIITKTSGWISGATLTAKRNSKGYLEGTVSKNEFDWGLVQTAEAWEIKRAGFKLDTSLKITARNGEISGYYVRPGGFDWSVSGTYDESGNINVHVDHWTIFGFTLKGKIDSL